MPSPLKFDRCGQSGIEISESLPRIGNIIDAEKIFRPAIASGYIAKCVYHRKCHGTLVQDFNGFSIDQALTDRGIPQSRVDPTLDIMLERHDGAGRAKNQEEEGRN